jgi:hypothetical protein
LLPIGAEVTEKRVIVGSNVSGSPGRATVILSGDFLGDALLTTPVEPRMESMRVKQANIINFLFMVNLLFQLSVFFFLILAALNVNKLKLRLDITKINFH